MKKSTMALGAGFILLTTSLLLTLSQRVMFFKNITQELDANKENTGLPFYRYDFEYVKVEKGL